MPTRGAKLRAKRERRKGDAPLRQPSGRLQRQSKREREASVMATVLGQPHRRGMTDQRCESALGRFCIRLKLRSELFQAGEEYSNAIRRWRLAKGLPVDGAFSLGLQSDATAEQVARLYREMVEAQKALIDDAGFAGHQAVRALIIENLDLEITSEQDGAAVDGLWALAIHFGLLTGRSLTGARESD